jgi:peptidoglycan/xylan/chitin deacetylase (PgdA/CDA1 family)
VSNYPNSTAVTPAVFEDQCRVLSESGWSGVSLAEAEAFLLRGESLPPKSFLMTFDDGYLDNYVHAWPILREYWQQAVIFAVSDRLDRASAERAATPAPRPTLEDVWAGRCEVADLPPVDEPMRAGAGGYETRRDLFFTWAEARRMEQSGEISIAAHSLAHNSVFAGPDFRDFYRPGPQPRTFYRTWPEFLWGLPRFKAVPELANRAFLPLPELVRLAEDTVPQDEAGAYEFFQNPGLVDQLALALEKLKARHGRLGLTEPAEHARRRYAEIMRENHAVLYRELGHEVRSFCWPWGKFSPEALAAGREAGFAMFFTVAVGPNRPGVAGDTGAALDVRRFKVRNKDGQWLKSRLGIYASPRLARFYSMLHN